MFRADNLSQTKRPRTDQEVNELELDYNSVDWYHINGRGPVASTFFNGTREHWTPEELVNKSITIDGKRYKVIGVDMYKHGIGPSNPYRAGIGICVDSLQHSNN